MPCLTKAFGEDAVAISDRIKQCLANDVADVEVKFNATRAPMYKRLQACARARARADAVAPTYARPPRARAAESGDVSAHLPRRRTFLEQLVDGTAPRDLLVCPGAAYTTLPHL